LIDGLWVEFREKKDLCSLLHQKINVGMAQQVTT
jgi:hypothetical protein